MSVSLVVNGQSMTLAAEPETPLLWAIREAAGLTGTKFGCGTAQCGACMVHVDGQPIVSCVTPVGDVEGRAITTIEGVSGETAAAVQAAWLALDVAECGYCQPGQIMSAIALLEKTPNPTDAEINSAMRGNICRCGIYHRIRTAVHEAARTLES
ncbi:MAG: (2Fe-2S)-binding protein [Thermomicrobiales bacterium]